MSHVDDLLQEADAGLKVTLARMRRVLQESEAEPYDLESDLFGVEDPKVIAARRAADEVPEPPGDERPTRPGTKGWREQFRLNWPKRGGK